MAWQDINRQPVIESFDLQPGRIIARKYQIESLLGVGWEGEVYLIRERATGIERTAKFFFPHRNIRDRSLKFYARKLHKLRKCPIIIQYSHQDTIIFRKIPISFLVSEFVEGELLTDYIKRQPGRHLTPFKAVHLLYALACGIECIHSSGEYHGDLHPENIIVKRIGLSFDLKLLDMFYWGAPSAENIRDDVMDLIRIFYDSLGGQKSYSKQPHEVKVICSGLKRSLVLKKFNTAGKLRQYLEAMEWS
ncbi:MAG: serine/threonine protein kinase [Gammaproteobacteria bacterium RBG_16_51_14]|nr:MAG: serine/threonine protein kinase [Gammaproteobacteria bacterium RBG_16_51_14]